MARPQSRCDPADGGLHSVPSTRKTDERFTNNCASALFSGRFLFRSVSPVPPRLLLSRLFCGAWCFRGHGEARIESLILPAMPDSPPTSTIAVDRPASGSRKQAVIALALLVPAPTVGVYFGMWNEATAGTAWGDAIYGLGKLWIIALPLIWLRLVQRGPLSWSPPRKGGFGFGIGTGIAMSIIIVAAWLIIGDALIDQGMARNAAEQAGLDSPARYLWLAIYLCTINALIEEYVWRWFCFRQCEGLIGAGAAWGGAMAVALSALFFTLHHILALAVKFGPVVAIVGSIGVFCGGCVWSYCYLRYRSIWPGFVSHAIVDVAVFSIGWVLIFGK